MIEALILFAGSIAAICGGVAIGPDSPFSPALTLVGALGLLMVIGALGIGEDG